MARWPTILNFVFNCSLKTAKAQRLVAHLEALAVVVFRGMFSVERNTKQGQAWAGGGGSGFGVQTLVPML